MILKHFFFTISGKNICIHIHTSLFEMIQVCQMFFWRGFYLSPLGLCDSNSRLTGPLTRSRWRVDTSARRTSLPCRWRWSWPAAGRRRTLSCRERSPEPCRSSQTSSCRPHHSRLHWGFHLRWWTLTGREVEFGSDAGNERKTRWDGIG